jgi:hypothetical protein
MSSSESETKVRRVRKRNPMNAIVDVGAFKCQRWFAEALMALIALEAAEQGKCPRDAAIKEADEWLANNGFGAEAGET